MNIYTQTPLLCIIWMVWQFGGRTNPPSFWHVSHDAAVCVHPSWTSWWLRLSRAHCLEWSLICTSCFAEFLNASMALDSHAASAHYYLPGIAFLGPYTQIAPSLSFAVSKGIILLVHIAPHSCGDFLLWLMVLAILCGRVIRSTPLWCSGSILVYVHILCRSQASCSPAESWSMDQNDQMLVESVRIKWHALMVLCYHGSS